MTTPKEYLKRVVNVKTCNTHELKGKNKINMQKLKFILKNHSRIVLKVLPVRAFMVSATFTPLLIGAAAPIPGLFGSRRKAGGGGRLSALPAGVSGRFVFVIDAVRRIGGGGLLP